MVVTRMNGMNYYSKQDIRPKRVDYAIGELVLSQADNGVIKNG